MVGSGSSKTRGFFLIGMLITGGRPSFSGDFRGVNDFNRGSGKLIGDSGGFWWTLVISGEGW